MKSSWSSQSHYLQLRQWVEQGLYEKASAHAREWRGENTPESKTLRLLISARVAIKTLGKLGEETFLALTPQQSTDPFLKAELHFTRGIYLFHQGEFSLGAREFAAAEALYQKSGLTEREILSAYNAYSGRVNSGQMNESTECLEALRILEKRAFEAKNKKLVGIILREKSEHLQALGKSLAAKEACDQSVRLLELYGAKSDYQIALVQAADVALDCGNRAHALTYADRVIPPLDQRVDYPWRLLQARLHDQPPPAPDSQTVVKSDQKKWQVRSEATPITQDEPALTWDQKNQVLNAGISLKIKKTSLEGKLLSALLAGPQTKSSLSETLWPEHCGKAHLDNRLHRLVSRFNQKTEGLIRFDGQRYRLRKKVVLGEP